MITAALSVTHTPWWQSHCLCILQPTSSSLELEQCFIKHKVEAVAVFCFGEEMKSEALQIAGIIDILSIISPLPDKAEAMQIL